MESPDYFQRVAEIPAHPVRGDAYWIESPNGCPTYTHYLFRFPAKFHPPVVRWGLDAYGRRGTSVLDPFTGSGTVQVEALVRGMPSVGMDIDPLACAVARVKTTPLPPQELHAALDTIAATLSALRRSDATLERLVGRDISDAEYEREAEGLPLPSIPNIFHWIRRYVVVDLARAFLAIERAELPEPHRLFFRMCLAAVVRRASNADPAPVSGLEVTRVQAERNLRRQFRVFDLFIGKARREIEGMGSLWNACGGSAAGVSAKVLCGDALAMSDMLQHEAAQPSLRLVVTSPPYCTAVEYSRRHTLELYWLGLVQNHQQHMDLTHSYVGRKRVRLSDWSGDGDPSVPGLDQVLARISERNHTTSRALKHYFWSMSLVFEQLATVLDRHGVLVLAIGDSVCCGTPVPTTQFLQEIAARRFRLQNHFSYAVRNQTMHYPLWNGRGIRQENILVLKRR